MNPDSFRHEYKYICSETQLICIQHRLSAFMKKDIHADQSGMYQVRSVYFDDMYHTCYYENENGTEPREKYRLRIYNHNTSAIRLECKRKVNGMTQKKECMIDYDMCKKLLSGIKAPAFLEMKEKEPVWNRFAEKWNNSYFRPSIMVEYDRTIYVYPQGNVRITMDRNITSSLASEDFFAEKIKRRPVMPRGMQLLEVKYDQYLPDYIYKCCELECLQRTAFSKFYLCSKYGMMSTSGIRN